MGTKKINILVSNESGQSMVEYIMVLGVVLILTFSVLQSERFKDFFGSQSPVLQALRLRMMYSYRHGTFGQEDSTDYNSGTHDTYKVPDENNSRFFTTLEEYP
jgi:hypothetical protein